MNKRKGTVILPTIIIFGMVIFGLVMTGLLVAQFLTRSNFIIRLTAESQAAAKSAMADVYLKLIKGTLSPIPILCNDSNQVFTDYGTTQIGRVDVNVKICRYDCGLQTCRYRVRAVAQPNFLVKQQIETIFGVNVDTGTVKIIKQSSLKF